MKEVIKLTVYVGDKSFPIYAYSEEASAVVSTINTTKIFDYGTFLAAKKPIERNIYRNLLLGDKDDLERNFPICIKRCPICDSIYAASIDDLECISCKVLLRRNSHANS